MVRAHPRASGQDPGGHRGELVHHVALVGPQGRSLPDRLAPHAAGTRFTYEHTGFTGVRGLFMARLLGRVRTKMLSAGLPAVPDSLDGPDGPADQGTPVPDSTRNASVGSASTRNAGTRNGGSAA
jgi:hypothetical protein